jgi:hypothetical protein
MAVIAMDERQDIGLRAQMFKELAQYMAPKRKAVEMSGPDNSSSLTLLDLVRGSYELENNIQKGRTADLRSVAVPLPA